MGEEIGENYDRTKNILLLEDDLSIASGFMYALEKEGYLPRHCRTIEKAMQAIREEIFQLAILDIQLPDGNGKEVGGQQNILPNHFGFVNYWQE